MDVLRVKSQVPGLFPLDIIFNEKVNKDSIWLPTSHDYYSTAIVTVSITERDVLVCTKAITHHHTPANKKWWRSAYIVILSRQLNIFYMSSSKKTEMITLNH